MEPLKQIYYIDMAKDIKGHIASVRVRQVAAFTLLRACPELAGRGGPSGCPELVSQCSDTLSEFNC